MNLERLREVAEDCAGEDRLDLSEPAALLRGAVSEIKRLRGLLADEDYIRMRADYARGHKSWANMINEREARS